MASPNRTSSGSRSQSDSLHEVRSSGGPAQSTPTLSVAPPGADIVPVEVLVEHLLAAKRSLSSMGMVLRANDLATTARQLHEEAVVLAAQTAFLRRGVDDQLRVLNVVRRGMARASKASKRDLSAILKTLDSANHRLEQTIAMLRGTVVERVFRPEEEQDKCLMDFVDERSVEAMQTALKQSINELQAAQGSFYGDLDRFDDDVRTLKETMPSPRFPPSLPGSSTYQPIPHLLASLTTYSHAMAEHLASLTRHFDMCVTAVRTTEGGAALARRKAAEVTQSQGGDPVSISVVIAEQESHVAELEPIGYEDRAEIVQVVVQDASEVDEVVRELEAALQQMERDFGSLKDQADETRNAFAATIAAFHVLEDLGSRLPGYVAAEVEFVQRWEEEKDVIFIKLEEMDELRRFYEGYASAYDGLILEVERRRSVDDKIQSTWRKARERVQRLVDTERKERELFRQEVGEFLPTDLWIGMNGPLRSWEVVPVGDTYEGVSGDDSSSRESHTRGEENMLGVDGSISTTKTKEKIGLRRLTGLRLR